MKSLRLLSILVSIVFILSSCSQNTIDKKEYNPTTLKELHDGYYDEELTPELNKLNKDSVVIVTTGHLYPLLAYPHTYNAMVDSIINQNPDYIFLLGDLVKDNTESEWDSVFTKFSNTGAKIYYAPGNHDLNYHYERWVGSREHQYEAEMTYINRIGYRYKLMKDEFANYMFLNPNDSIDRFLNYIDLMKPHWDDNKLMLFFASQSMWHNKHQIIEDNHTWMNKAFTRDEILPHLEDFDYLIHGDWGGKLYEGFWPKPISGGRYKVIAVGNRMPGDSLYVARLVIKDDVIKATSIKIVPPENSTWFTKKKD